MDYPSIIIAFALTLIAGLSTGIGSLIALLAKRTNTRFLCISLGFSAGVMLYISFMEMMPAAKEGLITHLGEKLGTLYLILSFFCGIGFIALIDFLIPVDENPHELRSIEDMRNKGNMKNSSLHRMGIVVAFSIAIHNFHDTRTGLPPLAVGPLRPSFFVLTMPFAEQTSLYELFSSGPDIDSRQGMDRITNDGGDEPKSLWGNLTDEQRKGLGSISYLKCPTRRSGSWYAIWDGTDVEGGGTLFHPSGPLTDYAPVFYVKDNDGSLRAYQNSGIDAFRDNWIAFYTSPGTAHFTYASGPWRFASTSAAASGGDFSSWSPMDNMSWWADGTSNQIVFGEKHIVSTSNGTDLCNVCVMSQNGSSMTYYDMGFLTSGAFNPSGSGLTDATPSIGRTIHPQVSLKKPGDCPPGTMLSLVTDLGFGSWHPGICHFLIGDGAVRSFSVTTDPDLVLSRLAEVNDGRSASLP